MGLVFPTLIVAFLFFSGFGADSSPHPQARHLFVLVRLNSFLVTQAARLSPLVAAMFYYGHTTLLFRLAILGFFSY